MMILSDDDERAPMRVVLYGAENTILNAIADNNVYEASAMAIFSGADLRDALCCAIAEEVEWVEAISIEISDNNVDWERLFKACLPHLIATLRADEELLPEERWGDAEDTAAELERLTDLCLGT